MEKEKEKVILDGERKATTTTQPHIHTPHKHMNTFITYTPSCQISHTSHTEYATHKHTHLLSFLEVWRSMRDALRTLQKVQ